MSSYNFKMGEAKGAAWIQGVLKTEKQMMDEQRLTGDFDTVAGASNSIQQSMVPLAAELAPQTEKPSKAKFYSIQGIETFFTDLWCHLQDISVFFTDKVWKRCAA